MMATSASAPSVVHLTTKEFPPEFENVFHPRNQSPKQNAAAEKVIVAGADRRQRIMTGDPPALNGFLYADRVSGFPFIGLLRMEFNGTCSMGTATVIAGGSCLLTCAHNVVDYDETTKKFVNPTSVWFELRENKPESGSVLTKRYKVTQTAVYPRYFEDPSSASGFDLALCWIDVPEGDHTVKQLYSKYRSPGPLSGFYGAYHVALVGFPGEHEGEKWGMVGEVPDSKREDWDFGPDPEKYKTKGKEILVYDFVDTSPGQSGSPVMGRESSHILGVHTGGKASLKKNWATYISPAKLKWIADALGPSWTTYNDCGTLSLCTEAFLSAMQQRKQQENERISELLEQ